ncbi:MULTISPECIES: metallophosphoesterase [unclassified Moraxella]|uniref:metallophosphoesterase n=1 Tax=unclassified Moraxella TaxID=2685852 RepID=UPI003AF7517D
MSGGATVIQKNPDYFSLIQISDLHLSTDVSMRYNGVDTQLSLDKVLQVIGSDFADTDLLVVTGDLLQYPNTLNYNQLFAQFDTLGLPYLCIAGNHDVTLELDSHLPFLQRRHLPVPADSRLLNCQLYQTAYWDMIFLDSSVVGEIHGHFSEPTLAWLAQTLASSSRPYVMFAHHPMAKVKSAWIDAHCVDNSEDFWSVVSPFRQRIKGIFVGHVHQECHIVHDGISMFSCPSTSVQFKPFCDDYTIDNKLAGLRWLTLYNNGKLATGIKRIDTM